MTLRAWLTVVICLFPLLVGYHAESVSPSSEQQLRASSEAAYQANNVGIALLEQYKTKEAVDMFRRALELNPDLLNVRVNLSIALFYLPDHAAAKKEAQIILEKNSQHAQANYIMGLIARSENQFDQALAHFRKVLETDDADVGANINIGQILTQQKKYAEATIAFRKAHEAEPYNETALYNLGLLLTRTGQREEGQRLLAKFQQLKQSGAGTSLGTNYGEGGHYADAVVSTGAEPELVNKTTPDVVFTDITQNSLPSQKPWPLTNNLLEQSSGAVVLFDFDGDGDLDLLEASSTAQRLYRNDAGKFLDVTARSGALEKNSAGVVTAAVAGDYDNDGKPDLFIMRYGGASLYHNDGNGRFSDVTSQAKIPAYPYLSKSVAFVDYDHDGDLDLLIAGSADAREALKAMGAKPGTATPTNTVSVRMPPAPNLLLRNNGNGTFTDQTSAARLSGLNRAFSIVPTDFDNRRDVDLLFVSENDLKLFRNLRDGTFSDVAKQVGLTNASASWSSVTAGDINKDGFVDFYFAGNGTKSAFALSDGRGRFRLQHGPDSDASTDASQLIDYDNDGLLDLISVVTTRSPTHLEIRVWRNVGDGWIDVSAKTAGSLRAEIGAVNHPLSGSRLLAAGDIDGDGDTDLIFGVPGGGLRIARNDGGNRNHSIAVNLTGRVSNKSAVEAKVEMRAGSLSQRTEVYATSPAVAPADLEFGLGAHQRPDVLRVLWPAGIVQAETEFPVKAANQPLRVNLTELDRKPSSCPYLYTWNGERFQFITDFMGGGEMGYLEEPGRYNRPDPQEYVRISSEQLKERNGSFELRVTNELEEAMFVDRLQLLAISHPTDAGVYPNEGMSDPPKPFRLFLTRNARPPLNAIDDKGQDVLDRITRLDRRYPDSFNLDRIRGYASEHTLTLKLTNDSSDMSNHCVLLLTGWTDYAWSSDNVAAAQAGKELSPPSLQVRDDKGNWKTVVADIGIPVGRPQTVTVDLTGKFLSRNREVRIVTNMRIYWDQILFADYDNVSSVFRLNPSRADLRWRGYSAEGSPDDREPYGYDYERVSALSPWKVMTGNYTREGDVRELLLQSDDMFVISRTGDELSLSFDAKQLPPLPAGWTRTFLLYADGFSKEMDINSASPDQLAPLPFHGMSRYPYSWPEHYPLTDAQRRYLERYNTRVVRSAVPPLSATDLR